MNSEYMCYAELAIGLLGFGYALRSDAKRRTEREWVHVALVNLKPAIEGPNKDRILAAINNMLEFLKPPKK